MGPTGSVGEVVRTLLTRRWLLALLVAALCAVAFCFLGRWQWGRHEGKVHRGELIGQNYSATPRPVDAVLPAGATELPDGSQWSRVALSGRYDDSARQMVRNRPHDSVYGYEVLVPFRL